MRRCRFTRHDWDAVVVRAQRHAAMHIWRHYMQGVYRHLMQEWFPATQAGRGLKSDLFEEAVTPHSLLADLGSESIGVDFSCAVVQAARARLNLDGRTWLCVVGDLRQLPLQSGTITRLLSGSSLDHFACKADIATSLAEFVRILKPGGILVITFDNPHNPVVWLRNHLPFSWLHRLRLVPYFVGATYDCDEARQQLEALGCTVTDVTAIAHAPRVPAIWLSVCVARLGWKPLEAWVTRLLERFEAMRYWPTRYRTGYYLALRAEKSVCGRKDADLRGRHD